MHAALRRRRFMVRVHAGAPFSIAECGVWKTGRSTSPVSANRSPQSSNGGHNVRVSIRLCESRCVGCDSHWPPHFSKRETCRNSRGGGLQPRSYPVRVWSLTPFFLGHEGVSKPAHLGSARYPGQHRGARPFYTEVQPDQRAGTVLKTDCSPRANGGQHLGLPPFFICRRHEAVLPRGSRLP